MKAGPITLYLFLTYSSLKKKMAGFALTVLSDRYQMMDGFATQDIPENAFIIVDDQISSPLIQSLIPKCLVIAIGDLYRFPFAHTVLDPHFSEDDLIEVLQKVTQCVQSHSEEKWFGTDLLAQDIHHCIELAASQDCPVLIQGESGTGKELVAHAIHEHPLNQQKGAFIAANCGAIGHEFIESELFGHEKGAFTGAIQRRIGKCEMAAGGTLFLDEIGDMSPMSQVKLLRVLQEKEFQRLGSNDHLTLSARIIAATHQPLLNLVKEKIFREDLFYRLNVLPIRLPALRERSHEIRQLVQHLISREQFQFELSEGVFEIFEKYSWPGNIRQLLNFLKRIDIFHRGRVVHPDAIQALLQFEPVA